MREFFNTLLEVATASQETGTAAGYVCTSVEMVNHRLAQGYHSINYGLDHFAKFAGWAGSEPVPSMDVGLISLQLSRKARRRLS